MSANTALGAQGIHRHRVIEIDVGAVHIAVTFAADDDTARAAASWRQARI